MNNRVLKKIQDEKDHSLNQIITHNKETMNTTVDMLKMLGIASTTHPNQILNIKRSCILMIMDMIPKINNSKTKYHFKKQVEINIIWVAR